MSIQALAWALDQQLPAKVKLALIALANHSETDTGLCRFTAATIAREASTSQAGLYRYLGALERNGYLTKTIHKGKHSGERDYWLVFSRDPGAPWSWAGEEDEKAEAADDDLRTDAYREYLAKNA